MSEIAPCAATPITPGVVTFDPAKFIALYPAFATVPVDALQFNFELACDQLNNTCCSVVKDALIRRRLLGLLTAHITALLNGANGNPPQGVVGRVSSATEGSVSVSAEYASTTNDTLAYYSQTPWGAQFWQATLKYRMGRYIGPPRHHSAYPFGYGS